MDFAIALPQSIIGWFSLIGVITLGGYNVWLAVFDRKKKNEEDADKASDRLIKVLKDQVDALERKVSEQETILKETKGKLDDLIHENKLLRDVLQGRDDVTGAFQTKVLDAVVFHQNTAHVVERIDENVKRLLQINPSEITENVTRKVTMTQP